MNKLAATTALLAAIALTPMASALPAAGRTREQMSRPAVVRFVIWLLGKPTPPWP
ncbi:MAG TPA: hypothetical protein VF618_21945 [Thermoanaerobaculia bacterium]